MRMRAGVFAFIAATLLFSLAAVAPAAEFPPNIIFIMADDMGWGDPGCYNAGSKIPTPNIDALASAGIRFTDAHAPAAVCVPTRYGLLTGCFPFRMPRRKGGSLIDKDRLTLGGLLKRKGYTTGCVGKWHLGFDFAGKPDYSKPLPGGPVDRGFDYYFGIPASLDIPPYYYIENDRCLAAPTGRIDDNNTRGWTRIQGAFWRGGGLAPGFKHEEVLGRLTRKAIGFLDKQAAADRGKPFFLYFALPAPHTPWLPLAEFRGRSKAAEYGDFTCQVDASVGRVLDKLRFLGLEKNTLVIFTSDNGPVWYDADEEKYGHRSTGHFRGMKGDTWEGGHRMPFIARWPGRVPAGAVSEATICHTDMLATFAAIVGEKLASGDGLDSFDISSVLLGRGRKVSGREALVLQSSGRVLSVRQGDWKLIPQLGSGGFSKPRREKPGAGGAVGQLYNLREDPAETKNLYREKPKIVRELAGLLDRFRSEGRSRPVVSGSGRPVGDE